MSCDSNRNRYLHSTYSGQELVKRYPDLTVTGVWSVSGEDPNADLGGSHHKPFLGKFRGRLTDVIDHAVNLSGFWSWGGGGDIRMSAPEEIVDIEPNTAQEILELNEKIAALEKAKKDLEETRRKFGIKE